jgi:ribosomal protein L11 methyltransferase
VKPRTTWIALRVEAAPAVADAVANFLLEEGATGVITEDASHVEAHVPADEHPRVTEALDRFLGSLGRIQPEARAATVDSAPLPEVDWEAAFRLHHRPVTAGRRLLIAPPWEVPAANGREVLVIEPGMAFGTGQHATTQACLEEVEVAATEGARSVLDVGTGSGVLAAAASRLGVARVVALDVDPEVLPLARVNLDRNNARGVLLLGGRPDAIRGRFDLVVANLLADALVAEARALVAVVAPGGRLVVSGLLDVQVASVLAAYPGWTVARERACEAWRTLRLVRAG